MLELLESRIAPAGTMTYIDVDGDVVTIKSSKGTSDELEAAVNPFLALEGLGSRLQAINLSANTVFAGTNLTITAKRGTDGGDGLVNVGFIDATGTNGGTSLDLGTVTVRGNVDAIDAGDGVSATPGMVALNVYSLGRFDATTGAPDLSVHIDGRLGKLVVKTDVMEADILVNDTGGTNGVIGSVKVGGSLIGGTGGDSGSIHAVNGIGSVKIGGSLLGGTGSTSGRIVSEATMGNVSIGGSVIGGEGVSSGGLLSFQTMGIVTIGGNLEGGEGMFSGRIRSNTSLLGVNVGGSVMGGMVSGGSVNSGEISSQEALGAVRIGSDLIGGVGSNAGRISSNGTLGKVTIGGSMIAGANTGTGSIISLEAMGAVSIKGSVDGSAGGSSLAGRIFSGETITSITIGGSLVGGPRDNSGEIFSIGAMGALKIGGNIVGGSVAGIVALDTSGAVIANRIASVTIGGSIFAGTDDSTGALLRSGTIRAANDIGAIVIKGSLIGTVGPGGDITEVIITARGEAEVSGADTAIKSLTIGGSVFRANILAGYNTATGASNADAQIGAVRVAGDWSASNLIAGIADGADNQFGTADDTLIAETADTAISRIASVTIGGQVFGTLATADTETFGFGAQEIGSFKAGGKIVVNPGPSTDLFSTPSGAKHVGVTRGSTNADGFDVHVYEV